MLTPVGKASGALPSAWGFYVIVPLERIGADPSEVRAEALAAIRDSKHAAQIERRIARARGEYEIEVQSPEGEPPFDIDAPSSPRPGGVD
jgi:hypothetical protein